jgi:hypothetical protein
LTLASAACSLEIRTSVAHHGMNLKPRRGLDHVLDLIEIADAGQFHQNLVGAQAVR